MKPKEPSVQSAFILAGGLGTRLRPITLEIAKTLLPVNHKPILEWNIALARSHGIKHVVLGLGYLADQITNYFGSGSNWGVHLDYSVEKEFLGTGGALKLAEKKITGPSFVMMNGDEVKNVDLTKLMRVHARSGALATIALVHVSDVSSFGIVECRGSRVTRFLEKEEDNHSAGWVNAGAYVISREVLQRIPAGKNVSMERDVFGPLAAEGHLACAKVVGAWYPTDTFERYETAIRQWKGR